MFSLPDRGRWLVLVKGSVPKPTSVGICLIHLSIKTGFTLVSPIRSLNPWTWVVILVVLQTMCDTFTTNMLDLAQPNYTNSQHSWYTRQLGRSWSEPAHQHPLLVCDMLGPKASHLSKEMSNVSLSYKWVGLRKSIDVDLWNSIVIERVSRVRRFVIY